MELEKQISETYGPLLSLGDVAQVLKRKKSGLQFTLDAGKSQFADSLRAARRKIGRRNLFPAAAIAKLVEGPQ